MTLAEILIIASGFCGIIVTTVIYLHTKRSGILKDIRNYIERLDTVGGRSVHALEARVDALQVVVDRNTKRIDRLFERKITGLEDK